MAGSHSSAEMTKLFDLLNACNTDPEREEYFCFWIAEKSLPEAHKVGRGKDITPL